MDSDDIVNFIVNVPAVRQAASRPVPEQGNQAAEPAVPATQAEAIAEAREYAHALSVADTATRFATTLYWRPQFAQSDEVRAGLAGLARHEASGEPAFRRLGPLLHTWALAAETDSAIRTVRELLLQPASAALNDTIVQSAAQANAPGATALAHRPRAVATFFGEAAETRDRFEQEWARWDAARYDAKSVRPLADALLPRDVPEALTRVVVTHGLPVVCFIGSQLRNAYGDKYDFVEAADATLYLFLRLASAAAEKLKDQTAERRRWRHGEVGYCDVLFMALDKVAAVIDFGAEKMFEAERRFEHAERERPQDMRRLCQEELPRLRAFAVAYKGGAAQWRMAYRKPHALYTGRRPMREQRLWTLTAEGRFGRRRADVVRFGHHYGTPHSVLAPLLAK